jgi:energy-coupling factor transporter ATP-binding protein EcfA2
MKYVCRVRSSVKKGCDVDLGPRTVIVGPNGSGKSTIVQSIELAAGGFVSDMEGREIVRQVGALKRLFPPGVRAFSEVDITDTHGSTTQTCVWEAGKDPAVPVSLRFPVQELSDVLSGDSAKVGAWLETQVLSSPQSEEDVLSLLPPTFRPMAKTYMGQKRSVDLVALSKSAKSEATQLRANATRTEKTMARMVEGVSPPLTDTRRSELQAVVQTGPTSSGCVSQNEYDLRATELAELHEGLQVVVEQRAKLPTPNPRASEAVARIQAAERLIRQHVEAFREDACMVCGNSAKGAISAQVDELGAVAKEFAALKELAEEHLRFERVESSLRTRIEAAEKLMGTLTVEDPEEAHRLRQAVEALAADRAAQQTWDNAEAMRREVQEMRAQATQLSELSKLFAEAGKRLLNEHKDAFERRVSSFLPDDDVFGVHMDSARVGLMRGEGSEQHLHTALSGAEESRVLLALAGVQEDGSTPCVLIPKDRGWDRDTLQNVMAALSQSSVQVVIMSTVQPEPVEGWTLVNME